MIQDNADQRARLFAIVKAKSFVRGDIELASGERSTYYFDMKPSMFDPEGSVLLCELIFARLSGVACDFVGGLEMGAVPLISPLNARSFAAGRPIAGFFVRKQPKGHGTKKRIEGVADLKGKSVVIVEDVTTTGNSAMIAVKELQEAGAAVTLVISILDRQQGASELYEGAGIPFESLFKASDFLGL
ncbi:MAG: orotate phosphoribosyltransferase [Hyphomicrobium sp.]